MVTVGMNSGARMANQMWGYAMLRSVAERNGYKWYFDPKTWLGASLFNLDYGVREEGKLSDFFELPGQQFNPEVFNVKDFTCLQGYWQSEKYFSRDDVKKWFKPIVPKAATQFQWEFPPDKYCYINVRGTDQKLHHLTLDEDYYTMARAIMLEFNQDLDFVVITDDPVLAKAYFPNYEIFCNDRDTDFCLLNQATFMIGAISTFAWWAAYLNDFNVAIFPKYFYHHKTQGVEGCSGWGPMDIHTHKFIWI